MYALFHQSKCISAIKRVLFYYRHTSIFVFFHVFVCSLLLRFLIKSNALHVGVKTLHNAIKLNCLMGRIHLFLKLVQ